MAKLADDFCVVRSLNGDSVNYPQSVYQMNTGNILMGYPSVGSWVAYGLGTENQVNRVCMPSAQAVYSSHCRFPPLLPSCIR
jgi:hypothetical protein